MNSTRRTLIKTVGIVAGSLLVGEIPLPGNDQSLISQIFPGFHSAGRVQAVLLGAGLRGGRFARFAKEHPEQLKIAAIGEPVVKRRLDSGKKLGLSNGHLFASWQEMLKNPPLAGVAIVTCNGNYVEVCTYALKAGYDVWVDKPVSIYQEDLVAINELARACNRNLYYCYFQEEKMSFMPHTLFENNPAKI